MGWRETIKSVLEDSAHFLMDERQEEDLMDKAMFDAAKQSLDDEIDQLGESPNVGITFDLSLYSEFRRRGLLEDKLADLLLWKWMLPSYRGLFVREGPEAREGGYKIGKREQ
jgi:hypothetical protein